MGKYGPNGLKRWSSICKITDMMSRLRLHYDPSDGSSRQIHLTSLMREFFKKWG